MTEPSTILTQHDFDQLNLFMRSEAHFLGYRYLLGRLGDTLTPLQVNWLEAAADINQGRFNAVGDFVFQYN